MSRAISLNAARDAGFNSAKEAPHGEWKGKLITKAWGKSVNLLCFFEHVETREIHRCIAFKSRKSGIYSSRDEKVDFSQEGIEGGIYVLKTGINSKGNPAWYESTLVTA